MEIVSFVFESSAGGRALGNLRLGCLASHGGTNVSAIVDACKQGQLNARVCVVIANNSDSMALERARFERIHRYHLSSATHPDPEQLDMAILDALRANKVDLVLLAGYMKKLGPKTLVAFPNRILNIHPALLPRYSGKGMYGRFVHEAVLEAGDNETGVTIHLVDEEYDHGPIVAQVKVPVFDSDKVESLSARVSEHEHQLYIETLQKITQGEIDLGEIRK